MSFLYVVPNPYTTLDKEGNPCGFCYADPTTSRPFQVVGGKMQKVVIPQEGGEFDKRADTRGPRVFAKPTVELRAVRVTNSVYHRERVQSGDLIAADLATAKACGIDKKDFRSPAEVLATFLTLRVVEWQSANEGELPPCADIAFACEGERDALVVKTNPKTAQPTSPKPSPKAGPKATPAPDA